MRRQPGRPRGTRLCDFKTLLRFLMFFRKGPKTVYGIYHGTGRDWDLKKIYRYLRYSADLGFLDIDHVEELPGLLPARWWRLTEKGQGFLEWCLGHRLVGQHVFASS